MSTLFARLGLLFISFAIFPAALSAAPENAKTIHVVVALCDNEFQGIVPVPAKIGNGKDPANNLYWGCAHGVKTFFKRSSDWTLVSSQENPAAHILERVVFKKGDAYLIADAYDGEQIREATSEFLNYAAGRDPVEIELAGSTLNAGGAAELVVYVGHNGLMDFSLENYPSHNPGSSPERQAAVFACASKAYFDVPLREAGAYPLIWTTGLMSPEAYSLKALADAWLEGKNAEATRQKVAEAYNSHQKCGLNGAKRLFATGW